MLGSALRQRILTALVLGSSAVVLVLTLPTSYLALCLALVVALAAWEWSALAGIVSNRLRFVYLAVAAGCLLLLWQPSVRDWTSYLLVPVALGWWALAIYLFRLRNVELAIELDPKLLLVGLVVLIAPWVALVKLHGLSDGGPLLVLFLFMLIWSADSAAYFAGRRWGREKLAPVLSPGKTWAGVYGALLAAVGWGLVLAWGAGLGVGKGLLAMALCVLTTFISVVGDLFESLLKRRRGVKDSGRLLPGHGGLLDRIDSLTAAAPVFTLGILWLGAGS
jgi:phosphatidate cytidylyltransferase